MAHFEKKLAKKPLPFHPGQKLTIAIVYSMMLFHVFGLYLSCPTFSLPRVVAIIAEALAVEVLPPDHPSKARLIGIVKQVQVSCCRNSLMPPFCIDISHCRGMLECLRLA